MPDDPRIQDLLDELSERQSTPEEICAECLELLPVVRARWEQMCRVRAELDALFPTGPYGDLPTLSPEGAPLPVIPGYEVEAFLGHGGMGVVFRARHLRLNRLVALKMAVAGSYAGSYAGANERERFRREAEAVAALRHPNVVQVYDVGEADGRPYFTMELLEGGSLARKLTGPQPARQAAQLVATLAGAVEAAHQSGIVHRDLKPSNVLLTGDGIPKINDFGLARRLNTEPGLTWTGTALGTPSYMAPEQARGNAHAVGPTTDVYALGAILYELLTGRPPFRADTAVDTVLQVIHQEPVPPSRLNAKVPRDLETICLKCLRKEPQRRYAAAAALADDLGRFLRHEPIAARPVSVAERGVRWVWRHRAGAGLTAGALALLAVAGGLWVRWQATGGAVEQARREQQIEAQLDAIHLKRAAVIVGGFDMRSNKTLADQEYEAAFHEAGLGRVHEAPEAVGARVEASTVRSALVAALDDWAVCASEASDPRRRDWLLEVAQNADSHAARNRLRDPAAWSSQEALAKLIETALAARPPVHLLVALGERFEDAGGDAIPFLTRVQQEYPGDFWANLALADALAGSDPEKAIGYYQTARTIRPGAAVAYHNLGIALAASSRLDEAIDQHREALRIDARYCLAHYHLGISLRAKGEVTAAIDHFQQALLIDPGFGLAHYNLGLALKTEGRMHEALDHFRQTLRVLPGDVNTHYNLGLALKDLDRVDEAIDHYARVLEIDPRHVDATYNLALALIGAGRMNEAVDYLRKTVEIDPNHAPAHMHLGLALRGLGQLDDAIFELEHALSIDPTDTYAHNGLGLALSQKHKLDEAIAHYEKAIELNPRFGPAHNNCALALKAKGERDAAIDHFQRAIEINREDGFAHYNLGLVLADAGRADEAIDHFRQALRISSGVDIHYHLGLSLKGLGRTDAAIDHYTQALEINPRHVHAHYNLALALLDAGRADEGIDHFRQTIEIDPNYAVAHTHLGLALRDRGQLDAAIFEFEQALRIDPTDAYAHNSMGLALSEKDKLDEAIAHYEKAIELNPRFGPAHNNCALALKAKGERDAAIEHFQRALEINRADGFAHYNLGLVLADAGRVDEAIEHYRQALVLEPTNAAAKKALQSALAGQGRAEDDRVHRFEETIP